MYYYIHIYVIIANTKYTSLSPLDPHIKITLQYTLLKSLE